jgi:hypothetical protein
MDLKQEAGIDIAAEGKKRKLGQSDDGWKIKEQQLQEALKPGLFVAVYCGTGASHSSGRIPYWLAHVRGGEGGCCAKYKVKKHFTSCGLSFNKNQWAVDLEQLDFKTEDKQHREQCAWNQFRLCAPKTC